MSEPTIRWIIFWVLLFFAPACLFLVMVVYFVPAVFFFAGIAYVAYKLIFYGQVSESLSFIIILGIHALVYCGLYFLVAWLVAKLVCLLRHPVARRFALVALLCTFAAVCMQPVYGGGGHGPIKWQNYHAMFVEIQKSYGMATPYVVYAVVALIPGGVCLRRRLIRERAGP